MDDSYLYTPPNPSVKKSVKWIVILLLLRVKNPLRLTAFLSLNPTIRDVIFDWLRDHTKLKDPAVVDRRSRKLANLVTVGFLFSAVAGNPDIPKDYWSLYFYGSYIEELNPPSSRITVYPTMSKALGIEKLKSSPSVRYLYARKHYIIYPLIFGQLLSNYLTPTKSRLNHKYLSSSIKNYVFNPIWQNYQLGVNKQSIHWGGLLSSYLKHNAILVAVYGLLSFRDRLWDQVQGLTNGSLSFASFRDSLVKFLIIVGHKANAMSNFIYGPNLGAMFLLSLTAPMLTKVSFVKKVYLSDIKNFIKNYVKMVGFLSAFATMSVGSLRLIPCYGYKPSRRDPKDIREISTDFYNGLNSYLLRLIILSKWRIVKDRHRWFSLINIANWDRIESFVLCYGVWNLMNLNDYVRKHPHQKECQRLEKNTLIRAVDTIMN